MRQRKIPEAFNYDPPLSQCVFYRELPAVLDCSYNYVRLLLCDMSGTRFEGLCLPQHRWKTKSGIRIWYLPDLRSWAADFRRLNPHRTLGSPLHELPYILEQRGWDMS